MIFKGFNELSAMKRKMSCMLFLMVVLTLHISCTHNRPFEKFDFTYSSESTEFSIKFTLSDTVYIRYNYYFLNTYDSSNFVNINANYFAIIEKKDGQELDNLLHNMDFRKYDTAYNQHFVDGFEYKLYIKSKNLEKIIYAHSLEAPKELDSLAKWIYHTTKNLKLNKTNKELIFKSKMNCLPPPPPPKIIYSDNINAD
jgi:hypothetical protein